MTEIAVQFRRAPLALFGRAGAPQIDPNVLAIRVQPDEGILLRFGAKVPGPGLNIRGVNMDFRYGSSFAVDSPDAYETLLLDCMIGDSTLFTRATRSSGPGRSSIPSPTRGTVAREAPSTSTPRAVGAAGRR